MPSYYSPRDYGAERISELLQEQGRIAAEGAARSGQIWGNALQGVGQTAVGAIQHYGEQRQAQQMARRDQVWTSYIQSGEWTKDPKAAYVMAKKVWGPEGDKQFQGLMGAAHLMGGQRDPEKDAKAAGVLIGSMDGMSEPGRAALYPQAVKLAKTAFPQIQIGEEYDPKAWADLSAMGKGLRGEKAAEDYTLAPGAQRRGAKNEVLAENAPAEKPETRGLDVQAAEALAKGDRASYDRLLKVKKEMGLADNVPKAPEDPALSLSPAALDITAKMYAQTGQLPPMGMGKQGANVRQAIINRAAELDPTLNVAGNKAEFAANSGALTQLQKQTDAVSAFEKTASRNAALLEETLKKVPDLGSRLLNRPWRTLKGELGSEEMAAFDTIRQSVQNEYARIISNPNLSGTMSDSARREAEALLSPGATVGQIRKALSVLQSEASNRHTSYQEQLTQIKGRMGGAPTATGGGAIVQRNTDTGAYRHSTDGGKTWLSGKP